MNAYILSRFSFILCFSFSVLLLSCTNDEENRNLLSINQPIEIRISTDALTGTPAVSLEGDTIKRLDAFVYHADSTLFEHLVPKLSTEGIFVATSTQPIISDSVKDVFVVANLSETLVEELKKKSSVEMKNFILTPPQTYDNRTQTFQSLFLMSNLKLKHNFSCNRVLKFSLKRIYSKIQLKFVCDYSHSDIPSAGTTVLKPPFVKVSLGRITNLPDETPLFLNQDSTYKTSKFWGDTFPELIPLTLNGDAISAMNDISGSATVSGSNPTDRRYDLLADAPNLKLYPISGKNPPSMVVPLKLEFYNAKTDPSPVITFWRDIELKTVKPNTNYLVTMYIEQLDAPSTPTRSGQPDSSPVSCHYTITEQPQ